MYKWPNRCSQLRYRASAIRTTRTLAPVQDYSVGDKMSLWDELSQVHRGRRDVRGTIRQPCVCSEATFTPNVLARPFRTIAPTFPQEKGWYSSVRLQTNWSSTRQNQKVQLHMCKILPLRKYTVIFEWRHPTKTSLFVCILVENQFKSLPLIRFMTLKLRSLPCTMNTASGTT
jgi:hypothetical protein